MRPYIQIGVSCFAAACGDNQAPECPPETGALKAECAAAMLFAARDSSSLVPEQAEIDRYFDRWRHVIDAEPILTFEIPQSHRAYGVGATSVFTSNAAVIAAWREQPLHTPVRPTGDRAFDEIMARLVEPQLQTPLADRENGIVEFVLETPVAFNEELLHAQLLGTSSNLPDPVVYARSDGQWAWVDSSGAGSDEATAQIDFRFGWGDCFVACDGFRNLRAVVPPNAGATVFDLGGDPLPDFIRLSPNTKPPP
jgi:hypothetical protein